MGHVGNNSLHQIENYSYGVFFFFAPPNSFYSLIIINLALPRFRENPIRSFFTKTFVFFIKKVKVFFCLSATKPFLNLMNGKNLTPCLLNKSSGLGQLHFYSLGKVQVFSHPPSMVSFLIFGKRHDFWGSTGGPQSLATFAFNTSFFSALASSTGNAFSGTDGNFQSADDLGNNKGPFNYGFPTGQIPGVELEENQGI